MYFFFFFFLGPVCISSGCTSAFEAYCALTDVLHGFEYSFQENFHKSQLLYSISLNHSQPTLYDPVLPVLPTLQVINNATGK
jgi:hypothetical protein